MLLIPKRIMQTWKTSDVPEKWKASPASIKQHMPDWQYTLMTDTMNRAFVEQHFSDFLPYYDGFKYPIQRADAIRYMWLYIHGGLYLDLDCELLESLEPLLTVDHGLHVFKKEIITYAYEGLIYTPREADDRIRKGLPLDHGKGFQVGGHGTFQKQELRKLEIKDSAEIAKTRGWHISSNGASKSKFRFAKQISRDLKAAVADESVDTSQTGILFLTTSANYDSVTNSIMASIPRHPFWLEMIEAMKEPVPFYALGKHLTVMMSTGPGLIDKVAKECDFFPYTLLPASQVNAYTICDRVYNKKTMVRPLEGQSWAGWDTKALGFCYCNNEWLIIWFLLVLAVIIIAFILASNSARRR
jgi:mannosyltransferase OCH1-like enzyme